MVYIFSLFEKPKINDHFKQLYESRKGLSIGDFAKEFDLAEVDTWVIRAVYEQIQEYLPIDLEIPLKSSDSLSEVLHIDDEDLDMSLVQEIAQRTGRVLKNTEENPLYGKVHRVSDLVLFFNYQAKANTT